MINKVDKINILLIILIIIIIFFCLGIQKEKFFSMNNFTISNGRLTYDFLAKSKLKDKENLYFIASINLGINNHLYFIKHNLDLLKFKIKNTQIEEHIPKITFRVKFNEGNNIYSLQKIILKADGDTIPNGQDIPTLRNLRFIPYKFIPNKSMGIKSGVKYFMIREAYYHNFLERNNNNEKVTFKNAKYLSAKHRHIFFLIPYYSESTISKNNVDQGINSIWKYF